MKKLFVQFYLLLFVCFLVMTMLVGLVYKFTAERAGRQSLDDLMKSSLYLMRSELREIPPRDWSKTLKELDLNLSFDLHIEPISKFKLSESSMQHLRAGDIVALDDQYTFIQRIPRSHYVLSVGPVPYLYFLHEMRLLDVALMAFIAISLAFPVFIWMRPHWQDMLKLESAAQRFGEGHLTERIHFDSGSSFERLGVAFNQMADNINALIASKKLLIDGIISNLSGTFDTVNTKVGEIAGEVGMTPAGWNGGIFNMIRGLSETVIVPIAGIILTIGMAVDANVIIFERIKEAAEQIDAPKCLAERGMVVINAKSALDHDALWNPAFADLGSAMKALSDQLDWLIDSAKKDRPQIEWDDLFTRKVVRPVLFLGQSLVRLPTHAGSHTPTSLKMLKAYGANGSLDPVGRELAHQMNHWMQTILLGIPGGAGYPPR